MRYQLYSYGDPSRPRRDQRDHGGFAEREIAEKRCRDFVVTHGRHSAYVMRNSDDSIVYVFDQEEAAAAQLAAWTVDLAEKVLLKATWTSARFLRALINEGGQATIARLTELTGHNNFGPMKQSLNTAARHVTLVELDGQGEWVLVNAHFDTVNGSPKGRVTSYSMLRERISVFDEALRRRGVPNLAESSGGKPEE